jgi:hypothetical protein
MVLEKPTHLKNRVYTQNFVVFYITAFVIA